MATVTLRPNSDASPNLGTPSSGSDHYKMVNDASDSTNLYHNLPEQGELFTFAETAVTGTINSVTFYYRGARASTGTAKFLLDSESLDNLTDYTIWADIAVGKTTNTWVPSVSWTWEKINAIEAGYSATINAGTEFTMTDIWVIVDYTAPPSTPTGVTASDGTYMDKVAISWSAGAGGGPVTGYYVYRDGEEIEDTASTSYDDEDAVAGIVYTYTVKAYGDGGTSAASDGNTGFMERSNLFTFHG